MRNWGRGFAAAVLSLVLLCSAAFAFDETIIGKSERAAADFRASLTTIEQALQSPAITDAQLTDLRSQLENIRTQSLLLAGALADPLTEVNQQLNLLGPAPTDGASEAGTVAAQRQALTAKRDQVKGAKSQLELVAVNAEQLASRASAQQRNLFLSRIFEGSRSILNPTLWYDSLVGLGLMATRLIALFSSWWSDVRNTANFQGLALIPVFLGVLIGAYLLLRSRLRKWAAAAPAAAHAPDDLDRLWRVVRGVVAALAILVLVFLPVTLALQISGFMTPRFALVYNAVINIIFVTTVYWALGYRLASPGQPAWRVVDLDDAAAHKMPVLVGLAAFISVADRNLQEIADGLYLPVSYTIGLSALSASIMIVLIGAMLYTVHHQQGLSSPSAQRKVYLSWSASFRAVIWLALAISTAALLFGFVAFGAYLVQQIFETAVLVMLLFLLHHLSDAAVASSFDPQSGLGRRLRSATGLGERGVERVGLVFRTVVDLLLVLIGLPLLFLLWTVTWVDFRSMVNSAFIGFRVGSITLSLTSILIAVAISTFGILLTNLVVSWMNSRILAETRVDKGVQDSLRKGASYAGYILAIVLALSAAGLDFSNIALVAGALGVGIGLGLQSIVNNFVSGLILLAERPIRVGDWVAIDAGEGLVKRINVRSTEIETFDSCDIIVPNSLLITGAVRNWTHGDTMGRVTINVSAAYGSDPEKVRDILSEIIRAHPKILTFPEPQVVLLRFGNIGLDFEARGFVAQVFDGSFVASDLRFAILNAFSEAGIKIAQSVNPITTAQQ
ncbi:DUF3772 domain-containing protein [Aestuariivirga sp.]|uniref:DUF3772 domain-containing protein n=1 Tax=Aestuariivirga sp. TaxID=2650926 RepID=UPI0039E225E5